MQRNGQKASPMFGAEKKTLPDGSVKLLTNS